MNVITVIIHNFGLWLQVGYIDKDLKGRNTRLSRPRFSKTLVVFKSRVLKYRPGLHIIIH